jgi:hypothetical protein
VNSRSEIITLLTVLILCVAALAQPESTESATIAPHLGPEGTRVEIRGTHLATTRAVLFGKMSALFRVDGDSLVTALVPLHALQDH